MNSPKPIEEVDPELGELILMVMRVNAKHQYPVIKIRDTSVFVADSWWGGPGLVGKYQEVFDSSLPNRNDPCLCGSGKKFKKCCGG